MPAIFGNLYSVRSDIYTSYKDQNSLVYTGHFIPTHTINTPTIIHSTFGQTQHTLTPANDADLGVPPEVIMGGDTFLGTVAITKELDQNRPLMVVLLITDLVDLFKQFTQEVLVVVIFMMTVVRTYFQLKVDLIQV